MGSTPQAWQAQAAIELGFLLTASHIDAKGRITVEGHKLVRAYVAAMDTLTCLHPGGRRMGTFDPSDIDVLYATSDIHADYADSGFFLGTPHP